MKQVKNYIGVRQLKAKPMTREEYNRVRGWELPQNECGSDDGYFHVDGEHVQWTPKDVFEEAYQESYPDNYEFGDAFSHPLEPWEARVVLEFDEVFEKAKKLSEFILGNIFDTLPSEEQLRMGKQLKAMVMYRDVLYDRITSF